MERKPLFSVTINDCRVDTFTVGGHGGAGKDTSNTGVRITHLPSGAVGRAVDSRRQSENKRLAWRRMAETVQFRTWANHTAAELSNGESLEQAVDRALEPHNIKTEVKDANGRWVEGDVKTEAVDV